MRIVWATLCTAGLMLPYLPAYLLGAAFEAVRAGWRAGRADVRSATAD